MFAMIVLPGYIGNAPFYQNHANKMILKFKIHNLIVI